jgi:hypothetical protein
MPKDTTAYGPSSNPASSSYGGGGSSGGMSASRGGGGLGIKTGNTIYGNTAFGPAGGRAVGYATMTPGRNFGMGPSINTYSNFRTPTGGAMIGGDLQGRPVAARNPQQALGMLQALAGAQRPRVGGLLADEDVAVGDIPSVVPTAAPAAPTDLSWLPDSLNFGWPGQAVNPGVRGLIPRNAVWPGQATTPRRTALSQPTSGYLTGIQGGRKIPYMTADPPFKNYPQEDASMASGPGSTHHVTSGYGSLRGR